MEACKGGKHTFKEISRHSVDMLCDEVVQWCAYCGGVVVIEESDGRLVRKIMEMEFPEYVQLMVDAHADEE